MLLRGPGRRAYLSQPGAGAWGGRAVPLLCADLPPADIGLLKPEAGNDGGMSNSPKVPLFTESMRHEFYERRVLVLNGELDDDNGTLLATQLITLASDDPSADISLWIHSPGGSVPAMLAIRDVMRTIPNDVSTLVLGVAYSAGQFLLSAGTKGKRRALPHARVLMHQGSAGIGGAAVDIELQADDLRHSRDTVLGLIAEDTGQAVERIFEDSLHDHWYTAEQALEYGFIDSIVASFDDYRPQDRRGIAGFANFRDGEAQ